MPLKWLREHEAEPNHKFASTSYLFTACHNSQVMDRYNCIHLRETKEIILKSEKFGYF